MPRIIADTSEVEGGLIDKEGTYRVRLDTSKSELRTSQNNNSYVTIIVEVVEDEDDGKHEGKKSQEILMLSGKGAFKIKNLLTAIGMDDEIEEDGTWAGDTDELHNIEVMVNVREQKDRPGQYQVSSFFPVEE